jgi:EAL domain-containing protein (putative c-di-GMP-specific phosphodiesterase class I)
MAEIESVLQIPNQETPSEENLLVGHLRRIEDDRAGNYAIHVHMSELRPHYRQPHYLRVASRAFDSLVINFDVTLYSLTNTDMVLVCHEVPVEEIDPPLYKLRALFNEDPLTFGEEGSLDDRFTTWYDLAQPADFSTFISVAEELEKEALADNRKAGDSRQQEMAGVPLDPTNLTAITARLQGIRIADLIRQQTAVVIRPDAKGDILFRETYVAMSELQKRIAPSVNLFANPWLFQYLTETLDRRVLSVIAQRDMSTMKDAISLNLNIGTVLSPGFQNFHEKARDVSDKFIIEMQTIDIFSDMSSFDFARDWLRDNGYRVLIDGLNPLSLQFFDPGMLGGDFVKISWNRESIRGENEERLDELREVVANADKTRVVLARVDSEEAVNWGLSLGIQRFQGHYVDKIVDAMNTKGII